MRLILKDEFQVVQILHARMIKFKFLVQLPVDLSLSLFLC